MMHTLRMDYHNRWELRITSETGTKLFTFTKHFKSKDEAEKWCKNWYDQTPKETKSETPRATADT